MCLFLQILFDICYASDLLSLCEFALFTIMIALYICCLLFQCNCRSTNKFLKSVC